MEEAAKKFRFLRKPARKIRNQSGQTIVEYLLVIILSLLFVRVVYFNREFGFKAVLDKTMLRLGVNLEQNLKSGTQVGGNGKKSLDAYAGTDQWIN